MRRVYAASGRLLVMCMGVCLCATVQRAIADEGTLEEVVVTGSRIPVGPSALIAPLTVMDESDLVRGGQDSLGKALQTLPFTTGSAANTNVNDGGDGSVRIDLRGLDPSRTLVLLNGRRFPNGGIGGDTSVDLNTIPLSLVERVEVLTNGASAIYGADAVAGVVNVITQRGYRGLELSAQQISSERDDGRITMAQLVTGAGIGKGEWTFGLEYVDQGAVTEADRDYSAVPLRIEEPGGAPAPFGSGSIPEGRFDVPAGNALGLEPGRYTRVAGAAGRNADAYRLFTPDDSFNWAPYVYMQTPSERGTLWLLGSYPLASDTTVFVEGLLHHRESSQRLAPTPYFSGDDSSPLLANGELGIPASNYYNPFGVDLVNVRRRFVELGDRGFDQQIDLWRALLGMRGSIGEWSWEATAAAAEGVAETKEIGLAATGRLALALGPSGPDASGRIVCGERDPSSGIVPATSVIAECVPVDLFGGVGSISREQAEYLSATLRDRGENSQRFVDFSFEGPWGRLPAGELRWALGAEYRREAGYYRFDPLRRSGIVGAPGDTDLPGGSFDVREVYVEGRAPLLRAQRWAHALDLTAGARLSDFSSFGEHTTWQAGLRWQPLPSWALRVNYADVFRAPNLTELYKASASSADFDARDPCGNSPTPQQRENCARNGVPGGYYVQQDEEVRTLVGGNPELAPETGASFSVGIDLRLASPLQLSASLDYFDVEIENVIADPGASSILFECAQHGVPGICALVQRRPDGTVARVNVRPQNFHRTVASGFDFAGALAFDSGLGHFSLELNSTYLQRRDDQLFPASEPLHLEGTGEAYTTGALPRWRAIANVNLERDRWRVGYAAQYIGAFSECGDESGILDESVCRSVDSVLYHDIEAGYHFGGGIELCAGINNVGDVDPPFVHDWTGANTDAATYRLLGRTYFARLRWQILR